MAKEIERKFLVDAELWGRKGIPVEMVQSYLVAIPGKVIRVRIAGDRAYLTIKGNLEGITRDEFEYSIPVNDALELLKMGGEFRIEKTRYIQQINDKKWEIDVFKGDNSGLIVAEIELESENETIVLPEWVIGEVSSDERYFNFNLAQNPFSKW
jgi:adenylate cyclase